MTAIRMIREANSNRSLFFYMRVWSKNMAFVFAVCAFCTNFARSNHPYHH